ncbi:MAG: hypothetical protein JNK58_06290 [Phycisphaerae bacterium]|nr:hypothetical protein [Phycisphaerae bacterium]
METRFWSVAAILAATGSGAGVQAGIIEPALSAQAITEPASDERVGADIAVVDVTGIPSWDPRGSPYNFVQFIWVGPWNVVNGFGFDVILQSVAPASWRGDIAVSITDSAGVYSTGFYLRPGMADGPGGPTRYSTDGIIKLAQYGIPSVTAGFDGLIRLEFFDIFEDAPEGIDGQWVSGSLLFQTTRPIPPVPAGSAAGAAALFLARFGLRRKTRPAQYGP